MDQAEKIAVRLTPDVMVVLQALVDRGEYNSLSETISDAIQKMIDSKFTPKEISKIQNEHKREKHFDIESLLTDGDTVSTDEAVRKAVTEYVRSRMDPDE
ncbi:MAG: ribbon-helix-helix domain-containing protein [Candidatus Methanoplasma sp.]|jgi:Arc/MetJ-type ribon-helix-helix transcriptional regulator|nr:ribbon-helix-helix domain-containing protein [Candidatus Methanoplasma sp.]